MVGGIEDQLAEPTGEQGTEGTEAAVATQPPPSSPGMIALAMLPPIKPMMMYAMRVNMYQACPSEGSHTIR